MNTYTAFITEYKLDSNGNRILRNERKMEISAFTEPVARKIIMSFHVDFRFDNVVEIKAY